jgi:hypothetical protein
MVYQLVPLKKYDDTVFSGVTTCSLTKEICLFYLEDEGSWLRRNKSNFLPDCTAWHQRRQ